MNITNSIEWKGLAFSFLFDTKQGGDLFNSVAVYGVASGTGKITEDRDVKFIFPGVFADGQPNTKDVTKNQNYYRTYYRVVAENYLEDGSWIRLRNISLSYTLDPKLLNKLPIKGATFVLSGYNLWISTDYSGFDPETSMFGAESNAQGFTGVTTPGTKSYSVGIKLTF